MSISLDNPAFEDLIAQELRTLYECYGYRRYRMGKFEPYDLYRENRNFLKSEKVITFPDASGRLMALKPDVTMSIVKNLPENSFSQKLYYVENVFRMSADSQEYREISQVGLESIGGDDPYTEAEVALLAMRSLEAISEECLLCVSHMGLISAVFDCCGLNEDICAEAIDGLRHKNTQALALLADREGLSSRNKELLLTLAQAGGTAEEALPRIRAAATGEAVLNACAELERLFFLLEKVGSSARMRIDFTLTGDMDYYNGVVFQGYLEGLPRAVLSGGRYDNLMRRFGKPQSAVGFAFYLGELSRTARAPRVPDADLLLIYGDTPAERVMQAMEELTAQGLRVRAAREASDGIFAPRICRFNGETIEEVPDGD